MLNIVICDDEKAEIEYLTTLVQNWSQRSNNTVSIAAFDSAEAFLFYYETNKSVDILLLDIQMKQIDGVTLAKKLRTEGGQMQIIFITGFPDFIAEGYEVSALHYLLKPINQDKLYAVLNKAYSYLIKADESIILETENGQAKLFCNDIIYAEAFYHYTVIQTRDNSYKAKLYISELENMLNSGFCRVHRSYLVGLKHIRQITKTEIVMDNNKKIPLSRRRYNDVNKAFINFHKNL
ncbi:MAG: LytTR family DNA-binding domain-containing protein [Oscillospiraceae bacterium]|jgi:DNA-binding LytR/AlgR family response regulator|nr:LytTR family DNA-binding domain-containing protein [Oscillospiraceae bacterium]